MKPIASVILYCMFFPLFSNTLSVHMAIECGVATLIKSGYRKVLNQPRYKINQLITISNFFFFFYFFIFLFFFIESFAC
jgi:hypothetical protein